MGKKQYQGMDEISEKAIELLTRNNSISNLLELLKIRIKTLEGLKEAGIKNSDLERLIKQKTALEMVEKEYGYVEREIAIFTRVKREIYLDKENITIRHQESL